MRPVPVAAIALLASILAPAALRAQDNSAAVEALFDEGKKLEAAGNYAEACPKFLASYNLEHRVGTLLNMADCYEKAGLTASAWARFVEARTMALRAGQTDRADFATQHAAALEGKLAKLTIVGPTAVTGLKVTRDGAPVDAATFGIALPIDPGDHAVEATAPGKSPWKKSVHVGTEAGQQTIEVPSLEDLPVTTPTPGTTSGATQVAPPEQPPPEKKGLGTRAIIGIAIAGAGVVAAGVGGVFGILALSNKSQSDAYCGVGGDANACYPPGVQPRRDAVSDGNIATILLGSGAALAAGGIVVWLTAPSPQATSVAFDGRELVLSGAF
jgi:serine/threonine-protein kinase